MKKPITIAPLPERCELRRTAEAQLRATQPDSGSFRDGTDPRALQHELEVHQIELEMQNAELRHARYELETALEKYTDLYEFAPVGYVTLDRNGVISSINLAGASLIGAARSTVTGRHFGQFVAVTHRAAFTEFLGTVLTCKIKESCEVDMMNMKTKPVIVHIEAMVTASGQEFRLALVDISERRMVDEALTRKKLELEELNSSLDMRINQAVSELRQKDQLLIMQDRRAALGEMIGNVAHQWRQPLNALGLYIQDLLVSYDQPQFNREFLVDIVNESMVLIMHMSRTIDDFSDFFRIDKEKKLFSVEQVIRRTLVLIGKSFKSQKIAIAFHGEVVADINGYPNEYMQVLVNILINSRDALLGHHIIKPLINIRAFKDGEKTVVTISDNAGGISEEIIDKIFDPYFTTKMAEGGTGIGLFMSKTIIEKNMGGELSVKNSNCGAEFRIII